MSNIIFVIIVLLIMIFVFIDIKKKRLTVKESFWWSVLLIIMLILAIWPQIIDGIAGWFGVSYPPALFFVFCILFLVLMNYRNVKRIDKLSQQVTDLEQHIVINSVKKNGKKK